MKTIRLKEEHPRELVDAWKGHFANLTGLEPCGVSTCLACHGTEHLDWPVEHVVKETCTVLKPDGSILMIYVKNVVPRNLCVDAFAVLKEVDVEGSGDNRGLAAGIIGDLSDVRVNLGHGEPGVLNGVGARYHTIKQDGTLSRTTYAAAVDSGTIGFMDYYPRIPYCRQTTFNMDHSDLFDQLRPFISAVSDVFKDYAPEHYQLQKDFLKQINSDFYIANSIFSTIAVNRSWRTALHKDKGDFKSGLGCMTALEGGKYSGAELIFPQYRVAVDMRTGGVCLADVHEWHGNNKIEGKPGGYIRMSSVYYIREKMNRCGSAEEENIKAKTTVHKISENHERDILAEQEEAESPTPKIIKQIKAKAEPRRELSQDELWVDFVKFSQAQIASKDIDPVYPILQHRCLMDDCDLQQELWRLALYVTFYDLGSAELWWQAEPNPSLEAISRIEASKTGIERRGMRGNTELVQQFLSDMLNSKQFEAISAIASKLMDNKISGEQAWRTIRKNLEICRGAGSWASYKWADLIKNVVGLPIIADDLGIGGGGETAGPIPGLVRLTGQSWKICASDQFVQENAYEKALNMGAPFSGLDQFETCLCDHNSLFKGHYYIGNDIDSNQEQLLPSSTLWESRKAVIPNQYLGELNGWIGMDSELKKVYKETGILVSRVGPV